MKSFYALTLVTGVGNVNAMNFSRILVLGLSMTLAACSEKKEPEVPLGAELRPADVSEIEIVKDDSVAGQSWVARLERTEGRWHLKSGPHGESLIDREANSRWVSHFLDAVRSLKLENNVPKGPLSSYGLDRPLFLVRMRDSATGDSREWRVGVTDGPSGASFLQLAGGKVVIGLGAALQLLGSLEDFDTIRERRLLITDLDDFDEMEMRVPGRPRKAYYQRQGEFWADEADRRLVGEKQVRAQEAFEALFHLQIAGFPEGQDKGAGVEMLSVVMHDRAGLETVVRFSRSGQAILASVSGRGAGFFRLHPEAKRWIDRLVQL